MKSVFTTGMRNSIVIPKSKIKDDIVPSIEYTTKFDDTLNLEGNSGIINGNYGSMYLESMPEFQNLRDIIVYYRIIENYPDVAKAIMHIELEIFPPDPSNNYYIDIEFDSRSKVPKNTQQRIVEEFRSIINMVDTAYGCERLFHIWYVDGRCCLYKVIDNEYPNKGILDIQVIDPINLFPIKVVEPTMINGVEKIKIVEEFYVYQPNSTNSLTPYYSSISKQNIQIDKDLITYNHSGHRNSSLGYLHSAIKPVNVLSMVEDAAVIYRIARAPERRVFYVDVGSLPTKSANAYLQQVIRENSSKISYDAKFGEIKSTKQNSLPMLEDLFLPRREGSKGTEVDTLQGGQQLGEINDIEYFQKKLRQSLYVPMSRFEEETMTQFGLSTNTAELSRDEMLFHKFANKLKRQHFKLYLDLLKTQCILKGIIKPIDWEQLQYDISPIFPKSNLIERQMELNKIQTEVDILRDVSDYIGKFYTNTEIHKIVLGRSNEEIEEYKRNVSLEKDSGIIVEED
jgi:hypothetical protein